MDFSNKSYNSLIRKEAHRLGFSHCGFSKADFLEDEAPRLERWLNEKKHGEMAYMANHFDKRLDPRLLVDGAKTVVSLLLITILMSNKIAMLQNYPNTLMARIIILL